MMLSGSEHALLKWLARDWVTPPTFGVIMHTLSQTQQELSEVEKTLKSLVSKGLVASVLGKTWVYVVTPEGRAYLKMAGFMSDLADRTS